jgi:hypothetical protein
VTYFGFSKSEKLFAICGQNQLPANITVTQLLFGVGARLRCTPTMRQSNFLNKLERNLSVLKRNGDSVFP